MSWVVYVPLVATLTILNLPDAASSQEPRDSATDLELLDLRERFTEIWPRSGPPGTSVTIRAADLPAITPVNIAIGGTRSGFEALAFVLTDQHGELVEVVELPAWVASDRTHRLIIFDLYFEPLSVTELFHVTDPNGVILRAGEITGTGPPCTVMSGADAEVYSLSGDTDGLRIGDHLEVEGMIAESTSCTEGTAIQAIRILRANTTP